MKHKKILIPVIIFGAILIGLLFMFLANRPTGPGAYDAFAQCLTDKGVVMHGTEWCPHCQNQKKMFGASFQYINYVDCDKSAGTCNAAGVEGYPTWTINGTNYPGEQTFYTLSRYSGCEI